MDREKYRKVHAFILDLMKKVYVEPEGSFDYPSLTTTAGKFYSGCMYTWDTHHMTLRYAIEGKPEVMKYFLFNMLKFQRVSGFMSCCVSSKDGATYSSDFHAQPFLAQNAAEYLAATDDLEPVRNLYDKIIAYLRYWLAVYAAPNGLYRWGTTWMSGFDNEIAGTIFQPGTILPPDLPSLLYLECRAAAYLGRRLGKDGSEFDRKAEEIKTAVNQYLWDGEMGIYSSFNLLTMKPQTSWGNSPRSDGVGKFAFVSCPALLPLFAGLASPERAKRMIETYVLSPDHFRSRFGIRSLSKSSEYYNNARWGNPPRFTDWRRLTNSNWQGPVWIPLNWFVFHGLLRYGYRREAEQLADDTVNLIAGEIDRIGFMRENFHAETGEGLYAADFASWNLLSDSMHLYLSAPAGGLDLFPWENEASEI